jgi:hypothetical protein
MTTFHYQRKIKSYRSKGTFQAYFGNLLLKASDGAAFFVAISDH